MPSFSSGHLLPAAVDLKWFEKGQKREKDMDWDGEVAGWLQGVKIARSKKVKAIRGEKSAAFVRGN